MAERKHSPARSTCLLGQLINTQADEARLDDIEVKLATANAKSNGSEGTTVEQAALTEEKNAILRRQLNSHELDERSVV